MKINVMLLSVFILTLALKPGADLVFFHTASACCTGNTKQCPTPSSSENTTDDGCCGKVCNPFKACGNCLLALAFIEEIQFSSSILQQDIKVVAPSNLLSDISFDFWQPPKIC